MDAGDTAAGQSVVVRPGFGEAVRIWAKIGLLGFGGPAGQIALMHRILVEEKRWISETRFLHALNYCMLLPGPEAQQLATYVGWLLHRTAGGVVAGTLFVLPGLIVILLLSTSYALFRDTAWLETVFFGLKAAVLAIVVEALIRIGRRALANGAMVGLAAVAFVAIFALHVPFPLIVLSAAAIGLVGEYLHPGLFAAAGAQEAHRSGAADFILETEGAHTRPSMRRALQVVLLWGGLWAAPVLALLAVFGPASVYMDMGRFFSEMAVVTFGGAYAVLAYVAQAAVQSFGWLQPGEMLDGLAMAETTPGPLILVLTFVGFMASFREPGMLDPLTAGLIGATLTTWVTFVPCFLWIFLGAPYVELLRGNRRLNAALSTITAAIVGVILNLALWFGLHVLFREVEPVVLGPLNIPAPRLASFDWRSGVLAASAVILLFRVRLGVLPTLAICAAAGALLRIGG